MDHVRSKLSPLNVSNLSNIAKARGVKGYYKMRKKDLVDAILSTVNILDTPVPNIKIPTLAPTPFVKQIFDSTKDAIKKTADWIINHISEPPKKIVNKN